MPVAVMAEGAFSFRKLLEQCETQELEVGPRGRGVSPPVGSPLLSARGRSAAGLWRARGRGCEGDFFGGGTEVQIKVNQITSA